MDEKQFRSCIMPLHKTLYAYALTILQDESDAADCLQESLTKLWENRRRLEEVSNTAAYATVTVRNVAVSMAAGKRRFLSTYGDDPPDIADASPSPAEAMVCREEVMEMEHLLRLLPDNQRKVVMLSGVAGLSNSEIRDATGLSDDNVRVLLSRGRKKLKDLFSKR